jgi:hypothetical protein
MATQITLTIPDDLYLRAQKLASLRHENVHTVLVNELANSMARVDTSEQASETTPSATVAREKTAYYAMHAQLWAQYPGQHVAIYKGKLVDYDQDGVALSRRIYAEYPNDFVLITQVEQRAERTLRFRSPRFITNELSED